MYEPQVNDYVIWKRPNGDIDEGWVYFKGDPIDNEKRVKSGLNVIWKYGNSWGGISDHRREGVAVGF